MQIDFNSVSRNMQNNTTVSANAQTSTSKELLFKNKVSDNVPKDPPRTLEEFKKFLADTFMLNVDNITAKSQIVRDLKFKDLDFVLLTLKLERMYCERFDENKIATLKTVEDLMNYIQEKTKNSTQQ